MTKFPTTSEAFRRRALGRLFGLWCAAATLGVGAFLTIRFRASGADLSDPPFLIGCASTLIGIVTCLAFLRLMQRDLPLPAVGKAAAIALVVAVLVTLSPLHIDLGAKMQAVQAMYPRVAEQVGDASRKQTYVTMAGSAVVLVYLHVAFARDLRGNATRTPSDPPHE